VNAAHGAVTRRGNAWQYRFSYRDMAGKRHHVRRGGFATKSEATRAMQLALAKVNAGGTFHAASGTLADYLAGWLEQYAQRGLKPSTVDTARLHVTNFIIPELGAVPLGKLRRVAIQQFYGKLLTEGRKNVDEPGGLNAKYVHNIAGTLRKALADAVEWELLPANPAAGIPLPKWERGDLDVLDAEEVGRFLAHAEQTGDPYYALWRLVFVTGLRRGELVGLRWSDVDLVDGVVSVSQSLVVSPGGQVHTVKPKTAAGRRRFTIDSGTVVALAKLKNAQDEAAQRFGKWTSDYVATDLDGKRVRPDTWLDRFQRAAKAAGVRHTWLHAARHTAAVQQIRTGTDLPVIARRLGHSRVSTTLDVYGAFMPSHDRNAADALGALFDGTMRSWTPNGRRTPKDAGLEGELDELHNAETLVNQESAPLDEPGKSAPPGIRTQNLRIKSPLLCR
jgi:integrase